MARVIDQVLGATTSSVVGEITRELVNASDGAGLHLEAGGTITLANSAAEAFGTSDFSLEFVLNRTANNTNNNVIYESHSSGNNRITLKALTGGDLVATFTNSSGVNADYNTGYDIDVDLNTVTHYALTFDRSGDLTVYKNGNAVATISIAASSAVDIGASNTNTGRIGYVTTYGIIGTFYRFRTWNKLVDAKALYERADVPFADQYGSAANIVGGYDFSTWATSNSTNVNATTQNITGASGWWRKVYSLNAGFKHRIRLVGTQQSGQNFYIRDYDGSATALTDITNTTGTVSAAGLVEGTSFDVTATYTPDSDGYMLQVGAGTGNIEISTFEVHQIGCISDYDLAYAQPALSTLIQDRSNAADGVASSTGVTQVQPITQLNSTSARIGSTQLAAGTAPYIPADGEIIATGVKAETYRSARSDGDVYIQAATASDFVAIGTQVSSNLLKVDGSGDVLVGAPVLDANLGAKKMQLEGSASTSVGPEMLLHNSGQGGGAASLLTFGGKASGTEGYTAAIKATNTGTLTIGTAHASGGFSEPAADLTINNTGLATFSAGINLGHETITKYDEGTFTPTLQFGGATTGITYSSVRGGVYTRIGRLVYVQIALVLTSKGSATGNATIQGLPFNSGDLIANTSIENAMSYSVFSGRSDAVASISGTSMTLRNLSGDSLNQNNFTDTTSIRIAGCYALASS